MRRTQLLILSLFVLGACASETPEFEPTVDDPAVDTAVAAAKADGAFGARDISVGDTVTGETSGDGLVLFTFDAEALDQIQIEVTRTSGDLRPAAYLFEGVENQLYPDDFDASSDNVRLNYSLDVTGEYYIVVRAYRGEGAGEFSATVSCVGGPCAGGSRLTGLARADQCLMRASDCALREVPSYGGRVGEVTAARILDECLAEEGSDCTDACDAHPQLDRACDVIKFELTFLADQSRGCLVGASYCLDACNEASFYGYGEEDYFTSATCWDGHQGDSSSAEGNCVDYYAGLVDCGGSDYEGDTYDGCVALCEATDGAWDEGPWDSCIDYCDA